MHYPFVYRRFRQIAWFFAGLFVFTLPFTWLASHSAQASVIRHRVPSSVITPDQSTALTTVPSGASCVDGKSAGTRCCSPEVHASWWCAGEAEMLGACSVGSKGGLLYQCKSKNKLTQVKRAISRKTVAVVNEI